MVVNLASTVVVPGAADGYPVPDHHGRQNRGMGSHVACNLMARGGISGVGAGEDRSGRA